MGWLKGQVEFLFDEDQRGFTLVELVVALTVLAIGSFGTMGVFLSSLSSTTSNDARATATAIATREVEGMRAAAYANVGFSSSAVGFVSAVTYDGVTHDTVVVDSPASTPVGSPETHKGVSFSIRRDIVWMSTSYANHSWKRLVATVTYSDKIGSHTVRQDAGVYPGGLGANNAATSTTSTTAPVSPSQPQGLTATVSEMNPNDEIDLSWQAGAVAPTYWEIDYSSDGGSNWVNLTSTQAAGVLAYPATGLSASTEYNFRVRGLAGAQSSSYAEAVATTGAAPSSCKVGAATVSPNPVQKKGNGQLMKDLSVRVNTSGNCGTLYVVYPISSSNYSMSQSGSTYSHLLSKSAFSTWSTGNKTIYIRDISSKTLATIALLVTR